MTKRNLLVAFLSLIVLTALSAVFIHFWLHRDPPPSVVTAENALATEGLFTIGYLNHSRLSTIFALLAGEDDPDPFVIPGVEATLWNDLYRGTVNLHENVDQVVFGMVADQQTNASSTAMIISGQFDWKILQPVLGTYYEIQSVNQSNYRLKAIPQSNDTRVCPSNENKTGKKSQYIWLHVSPDWLITATDEVHLKQLQQRISQKSDAEIDLARWRDYRNNRLASVGFLAPKSAGKTAGVGGLILGGAAKSNPEVTGLFLGSSVSYQPAGVSFNLQVDSNNPQWVNEKRSKAETMLSEITNDASAYSPTLVELLSGIRVAADDNILNMNADIRLDTVKKLPDIAKESFTAMFSSSSVSHSSSEILEQESINQSPWNFAYNQQLAKLPNFVAGKFDPIPLWVKGPLAINMSSIRLGDKSRLLELQIDALLQLIKAEGNWWDSKAQMQLFIESVTDATGQELLRDELCSKDLPKFAKKNREPESGFNGFQKQNKLTKTIRLNKGSHHDAIQSIKGYITLTAPIQVKRIPLEFKKGVSAEHAGLRFYISATGQQDISFRTSGDIDKLVEIRALNKNGKVLNRSTSISGDGSGNNSYRGDIHKIEIYVAEKRLEKRFDFELGAGDVFSNKPVKKTTGVSLPYVPDTVALSDWQKLGKLNMSSFTHEPGKVSFGNTRHIVSEWRHAPMILTVDHNMQYAWNTSPIFELHIPFFDSLAGNLGAVELQIRNLKDDAAHRMAVGAMTIYSTYGHKEKVFKPRKIFRNVGFTLASTSLNIGLEQKQKIRSLSGQLIIRLPQTVHYTKLSMPGFYKATEVEQLKISLKEIDQGQIPRLKYEVTGNVNHFINLVAITSTGERLFPTQSDLNKGKWVIQYALRNDIEQLELIHAGTLSTIEYPFELKATYPQ